MSDQRLQITDRYTGPLMGVSLLFLAAGALVAMIADSPMLLNIACGLALGGLAITFAAGFTRHRYEQSVRTLHLTKSSTGH